MKKFIVYLLVLAMLICTFGACSSKKENEPNESAQEQQEHSTLKENDKNGVKIPDIIGTDLESAKTIVLNMGLVPIIEEGFSNEFLKGKVMACEPEVGTTLEKGSSVTITVSKGSYSYVATSITGTFSSADGRAILLDGWSPVTANISNFDNTIFISIQINDLSRENYNPDKWLIATSGNDARISLSSDFTVSSIASYVNTIESYYNEDDTYRQTVNLTASLDMFNTEELPTTVWVKIPSFIDRLGSSTLIFKLNFIWETEEFTDYGEFNGADDYNGL